MIFKINPNFTLFIMILISILNLLLMIFKINSNFMKYYLQWFRTFLTLRNYVIIQILLNFVFDKPLN